jgi:hypothetical protein
MWSDDNDYSVRTSGISSDGTLLDASGSLVGHQVYSTSGLNRSVVGTGSSFIAVWPAGDYGIWAARLDSAGALIDTFLVFESDSGEAQPAVAFDGDSTCLVVWAENPYGNSDVYAVRVSTGGRVLDPKPARVAQEGSQIEMMPTVAFGQGVYVVAWTSFDSSYSVVAAKARRVSAGGAVLDTSIFLRHDPASMQALPAVAFGDTCFLASWAEGMAGFDVYAARVSVSGNLIDTAGVQLSSGPTLDMYPSVGFDGTRYLVMWCEVDTISYRGSLRGRRMTVDGVPLDSGLIRPELPGYSCEYPSVAADQANFLVAFSAYDTLSYDYGVCCVRISPDGAVLDSGIFFPMGADEQFGPSGASDGTDFLAAWLETRAQGQAVNAARIRADGVVLDSVGFPVDEAPGQKYNLATGFGDSLYLVAWEDYRGIDAPDIYCARVSRDGQVLDPDGIVVCDAMSSQYSPDISFDGQNFLVVWQDYRSAMYGSIYAARVSLSGVVLDLGGFAVAAADTFDDAQPAVCFTGTDYLVVWPGMNTNVYESRVYGALVSPAGTVTKPRFVVGGAENYQNSPSVASGPTNSLVTWEDARLSGSYDIYAARVQADGTVLDPNGVVIAATSYDEQSPRVMSDADGFRVLWHRLQYADSIFTFYAAARVDTAGNVSHVGDWFGLPGYDNGSDAVYGSGPELLLLFSCWTDTALGRYYGTDRLWGRLDEVPGIEQGGNGQPRNVAGGATIVRGVLWAGDRAQKTGDRIELLDISGRRVLDLHAGPNDISHLSPGVYFVREAQAQAQAQAQAVRKVVVTR